MQFDHVAQRVSDIGAAVQWWQRMVPGAVVLYQDDTWGLLEAGGAKLAFVMEHEHPDHLAFKVSPEELERMAGERDVRIAVHRDGSRSFYTAAPGGHRVEVVAYPDAVAEDAE